MLLLLLLLIALFDCLLKLFSHKLLPDNGGDWADHIDSLLLLILLKLMLVSLELLLIVVVVEAPQIVLLPQTLLPELLLLLLPLLTRIMTLALLLQASPFTLESPDDKNPESPLLLHASMPLVNFIERNSCINELTMGSVVVVESGDEVERMYWYWYFMEVGVVADAGVDIMDLGDSNVASCYGHCWYN